MPWKNQSGGGGPWGGDAGSGNGSGGGGGGGPWGAGGGGGGGGGRGPTPPGFDDLIRQSQDRMKRFLPGGFFGGRGIVLIIIGAIVIWLATGFYRVQPGEQGVVLRFGQFIGITDPGLNYRLPGPIEDHEIVNVNLERLTLIGVRAAGEGREGAPLYNFAESRMLTGDENLVDLGFAIVWNVVEAPNFVFNVRDPESTVRFIGESVMREVIGQRRITELIVSTGAALGADADAANVRREIELRVATLLQERLNFYGTGISVVNVQLQGVDPPTEVIDAFRDVQNAESEAEAMINTARAYANQVIPRARAEAYSVTQEARAYSERVRAQADGDAARFLQVLEAYDSAQSIVAERLYIETVSAVFADLPKVIIDLGSATQGVLPYLPLEAMQGALRPQTGANGGGN
ncbi:MAG: FtsH protease activity modulator HflK [Alphaproteobacteria bacterium]